MTRSNMVAAALVSATVSLAGCHVGGGVDKAGTETTVLRVASFDQDSLRSPGPKAFLDSLATVSGGQLKVQLVSDHFGDGAPQAETDLVKAIASGELDGGWPATRAFARAGITGLESVEAPLTITSYAAEKTLVSGPTAGRLLDTLDGSRVVGLGLAVGGLRRPFAVKAPLLDAADWTGVRFRSFNSPVQDEVIRVLGGIPVPESLGWIDEVKAGTLRGAELDITNTADLPAGYVTSNVVLWPKVFVLSLSRKRFDALSRQQQTWVRQAAGAAVQASVNGSYDEGAAAEQWCRKGVHFRQASPDQVASLRTALVPVRARLAADPISGPLLREIDALVARHPQPDRLAAAESCQPDAAGAPVGAIPATPSAFPDGVYRVAISADDVWAAGMTNTKGVSGTWTLTVRDSTYEVRCRPLDLPGTDCGHAVSDAPLDVGDLRGIGHTVYFIPRPERLARLTGCRLPISENQPGHCGPGDSSRATWTLKGDILTFTDTSGHCDDCDNISIKPWRKIA